MNIEPYLELIWSWIGHKGLKIFLIILLALIALRTLKLIIKKVTFSMSKLNDEPETQKRMVTLQNVLQHSINMVILTVSALMVLIVLEINIAPRIAPIPKVTREVQLAKGLCNAPSINSYNPITRRINAPEIPGKNIAEIAIKPAINMYNNDGVRLTGIAIDNITPKKSPNKPNNLFVNL